MKAPSPLHLVQPRSVSIQIAEQLRGQIQSGQWTAGQRLPAATALAVSWGVDSTAVHRALAQLAKEGWLDRAPKRGTFVRRRESRMTCVAIYQSAKTFSHSLYLQALQRALQEELTRAGIEVDIWMDPRPGERQLREAWNPLVQAAERREFQALIAPCTDSWSVRWQRSLPVPVATGGGPSDLPSQVIPDGKQFVDLSLHALARQGCRSVGLIAPILTNPPYEGGMHPHSSFLERFTQVSRDLGLAIRNEWTRVIRYGDPVAGPVHETFGYRQLLELWKQDHKPQGLVVTDDVTARGVILGLREQQVRVPQDLKLVLSKNESIDLVCPMPATFVVLSERAVARALIAQVQKQFRGARCEPILVPYRTMVHRWSRDH